MIEEVHIWYGFYSVMGIATGYSIATIDDPYDDKWWEKLIIAFVSTVMWPVFVLFALYTLNHA